MKSKDTKQRLFEIMQKVDNSYKLTNVLNETKAFGQLRKSNKELYDETIKLEDRIGGDVLKLIDDAIKKENFKYKSDEERELVYLIILDLVLDRYLDRKTKK
jgi:hypothetical protein